MMEQAMMGTGMFFGPLLMIGVLVLTVVLIVKLVK